MADRVYPSSKPNGNGMNPPPQNLNGAGNPSFPATKAQLYGQSRPTYRPQPKPRRRSRSCCCSICLWVTVFLIGIILLAAIAGAIFWVVYHPQRPSFSVKTLQISRFNITTPKNSSPILKSNINFTISSRNPNKKIVFIYDPIVITMKSNGVGIGNGSFPSYVHQTKNTTSLKALVTSGDRDLDSEFVKTLNSDLKKTTGLPMEIQLETKVKVKIGGLKTNKLPIRVICKGAQVTVPQKKGDQSSMKGNAKCKVHLKIKIWKWTLN